MADLFQGITSHFSSPPSSQWHPFISQWYENAFSETLNLADFGNPSQWASRLHLFLSELTLMLGGDGVQTFQVKLHLKLCYYATIMQLWQK